MGTDVDAFGPDLLPSLISAVTSLIWPPGLLTPYICTSPSMGTLHFLIRVQRGPLISWSCVSGQPEHQLIFCPMNGSDCFTMAGAVVVKIGQNVVEMWISISVKDCDCMQPLTHTHSSSHFCLWMPNNTNMNPLWCSKSKPILSPLKMWGTSLHKKYPHFACRMWIIVPGKLHSCVRDGAKTSRLSLWMMSIKLIFSCLWALSQLMLMTAAWRSDFISELLHRVAVGWWARHRGHNIGCHVWWFTSALCRISLPLHYIATSATDLPAFPGLRDGQFQRMQAQLCGGVRRWQVGLWQFYRRAAIICSYFILADMRAGIGWGWLITTIAYSVETPGFITLTCYQLNRNVEKK